MATTYTAISVDDPRLRQGVAGRRPMVSFGGTLLVPCRLTVPAVAFGGAGLDEATRAASVIEHPAVMDAVIADAVVHGPDGVVTVGDWVLAETLSVHTDLLGYRREGDRVVFPEPGPTLSFGRGLSAFGPGYGNHFHFLMEILPRLRIAPFAKQRFDGLVLLPARLTGPQLEVAGLIGRAGTSIFLTAGRAAIHVRELYVASPLGGALHRPHPSLAGLFDGLREALGGKAGPGRRIYVSRRDTVNRVLANEAEVIAVVQAHGFEVVELAGQSLAAQAELFAGASHIVAPHGAGLTNVVFAKPGTALLELHMDKYLNWCFRRLCGLHGVTYGCVVGPGDGEVKPDGDPHHLGWSVPLDQLQAALADPRFLGAA